MPFYEPQNSICLLDDDLLLMTTEQHVLDRGSSLFLELHGRDYKAPGRGDYSLCRLVSCCRPRTVLQKDGETRVMCG